MVDPPTVSPVGTESGRRADPRDASAAQLLSAHFARRLRDPQSYETRGYAAAARGSPAWGASGRDLQSPHTGALSLAPIRDL